MCHSNNPLSHLPSISPELIDPQLQDAYCSAISCLPEITDSVEDAYRKTRPGYIEGAVPQPRRGS